MNNSGPCKHSPKINIVWNITRLCSFQCAFCCVKAIPINEQNQIAFPIEENYPELSYTEKLRVIDQIDPLKYKIDFSGGDFLINPQNFEVLRYASKKFKSENISISIPGTFLNSSMIKKIKTCTTNVELSIDLPPNMCDTARSSNLNLIAYHASNELVKNNFSVGIQTILRNINKKKSILSDLYHFLCDIGVAEWSILRLMPVGKIYGKSDELLSSNEHRDIIYYLLDLCKKPTPILHIQYLFGIDLDGYISCRAARKSIGITPSGVVTSCFWAVDNNGLPIKEYELGKVPEQSINEIMNSEKSLNWQKYADRHDSCKLLDIIRNHR